jgi:hypothetical protein
MFHLSRPATFAIVLVGFATVGFEVAAIVVYRHSTDGQTPVLWTFIVLYGLVAVGAIMLIDSTVRRLRRRSSRQSASGNI